MPKNCLLSSAIERFHSASSFNSTGSIIQEETVSNFLIKKSYLFVVSFKKNEVFNFELEEIGDSFGKIKLAIIGENGQFSIHADEPRMSHKHLSLTNQQHQVILGSACVDMFQLVWNNFFEKASDYCYLRRLEQVSMESTHDGKLTGIIENPFPSKFTVHIDKNSSDLLDIEICSNISLLDVSNMFTAMMNKKNNVFPMDTLYEALEHLATATDQRILKKTFYQFTNIKVT